MTNPPKTDDLRAALVAADALMSAVRSLQAAENALINACKTVKSAGKTYTSALSVLTLGQNAANETALGAAQTTYYSAQAALARVCKDYTDAYQLFESQMQGSTT